MTGRRGVVVIVLLLLLSWMLLLLSQPRGPAACGEAWMAYYLDAFSPPSICISKSHLRNSGFIRRTCCWRWLILLCSCGDGDGES